MLVPEDINNVSSSLCTTQKLKKHVVILNLTSKDVLNQTVKMFMLMLKLLLTGVASLNCITCLNAPVTY